LKCGYNLLWDAQICEFYDLMTVHRNRFLVNKTNRRTEFQIYWYYNSTCFGRPFRPSSGVLSCTSAMVHFIQFWWPFATRNGMELLFYPAPGSKRSSKLHETYQCRCTAKNSCWRAERPPETYRVVIPTKLEFSASVGFIPKEFVTMQGHTILKKSVACLMKWWQDTSVKISWQFTITPRWYYIGKMWKVTVQSMVLSSLFH
jgi:hypothetical protein